MAVDKQIQFPQSEQRGTQPRSDRLLEVYRNFIGALSELSSEVYRGVVGGLSGDNYFSFNLDQNSHGEFIGIIGSLSGRASGGYRETFGSLLFIGDLSEFCRKFIGSLSRLHRPASDLGSSPSESRCLTTSQRPLLAPLCRCCRAALSYAVVCALLQPPPCQIPFFSRDVRSRVPCTCISLSLMICVRIDTDLGLNNDYQSRRLAGRGPLVGFTSLVSVSVSERRS